MKDITIKTFTNGNEVIFKLKSIRLEGEVVVNNNTQVEATEDTEATTIPEQFTSGGSTSYVYGESFVDSIPDEVIAMLKSYFVGSDNG